MLRFIHLLFLSLIFLFDAAWADEQPAIVYGADEAFRPYEWFSDEGNLEGFQIELIRAIGEAQGRRISFVTGPWSKIRQSLLDGSVQVVSMFDQPVRRIYADFSKPHSVLASEIFVRIGSKPILSVQELAGKEVIQQEGALSAEYLRTLGIRYTSIQVKDQFDAMRLLATGKHDCVITTQVGGRYALQKLGIRNVITTGQPVLASNVAFAVRKGNSNLLEWLNSGLDRVKANGTYDVLYQKWFGESNRVRMSDLQAMRNVFVGIGLAIVVLVAVIGLWIKMLRRAVSTKTFELQYLADHDSLTGLYNRHYITNAIHSAIADFHLHSGQRNFGILFIDLDRFKLVNDSLGHHVGDLLIKAVGFELLASVEDRCRVARWGG
ncbi:MAG TPA: transporter substrate-binding domain-containing protein, partial [Turneriella sp.]|nr:transporter substrate-binding domain-containing protein [Turneriella sp.]